MPGDVCDFAIVSYSLANRPFPNKPLLPLEWLAIFRALF
jgi:hypothetical protein